MDLLIIVDFQNDFVEGSLGFPQAKDIEPYIVQSIQAARRKQTMIRFTLDTHDEDYLETEEGKHLPIPHCIVKSDGHRLYGEVNNLAKAEELIEKNTFGSAKLFTFLLQHSFQTITLMGLVSNMCVLANAILCKSACPNAHIIVDANGSRSFDEATEQKAYAVLEALHIEVRR